MVTLSSNAKLMMPAQAVEALRLVEEHKADAGTVAVHWASGISRSPAVVANPSRVPMSFRGGATPPGYEINCEHFRQLWPHPDLHVTVEAAVSEAKRCLHCDLRLTIEPPALPPERWLAFSRESVDLVPVVEGVAVLADADKKPIRIKGVADVQAYLRSELDSQTEACFFLWEQEHIILSAKAS